MSVSVKRPLYAPVCLGWLPHGCTKVVARVDPTGFMWEGPVKLKEDEVKKRENTGRCMNERICLLAKTITWDIGRDFSMQQSEEM